jgi:hypothetical protein
MFLANRLIARPATLAWGEICFVSTVVTGTVEFYNEITIPP